MAAAQHGRNRQKMFRQTSGRQAAGRAAAALGRGTATVLAAAVLATAALTACTADRYDKGEGPLSALYCTMADAHTDAQCRVTAFVNDDGSTYTPPQPVTASWITTPDTTYCVAVYYNRNDMTLLSMSPVLPLVPVPQSQAPEAKADPVVSASGWLSADRCRLYLDLRLKGGHAAQAETRRTLALVGTGTETWGNGRTAATFQLSHNQGGVPLQYTVEQYFAIPVDGIQADTVRITFSTFKGQKSIAVPTGNDSRQHMEGPQASY